MKYTGKEFAKVLADRQNCTIRDANRFIKNFTELIVEVTETGDEIGFQGFGCFKRSNRKQKDGVHPLTHKKVVRPAYSILTFKSSENNKGEFDEEL